MRCHFIDDVSNHVVQCWVAGAEFPHSGPNESNLGASHCFQNNICLGGMEKDSSDLGEAWDAGEHASCLEVGLW